MSIKISSAPCCWGVDNVNNPYLPKWERVLEEASLAGYRGIELGPYGYIPLNAETLAHRQVVDEGDARCADAVEGETDGTAHCMTSDKWNIG